MAVIGDPRSWQYWQDSWDRQQELYLPDREERFSAMLDRVAAIAGEEPVVLDLACGTGSITARVLRRFPAARCTAVDRDPALLAIARGWFAGDHRVDVVTADLTDQDWTGRLPHRCYDAVLTATALHWLPAEPLRELYRRVAGVLRPGGAFLNSDYMPDPATPRIDAVDRAVCDARTAGPKAAGALDWDAWWEEAGKDEALAGPVAERFARFGAHSAGDPQPVAWHTAALIEAGFTEARAVLRSGQDAIVMALTAAESG